MCCLFMCLFVWLFFSGTVGFRKFFFTDGSHNPLNTAGKRLGCALAVLAEKVDGKWAILGAQAASECHDPVEYNLIGDSSHSFTELLTDAWAASCGIPLLICVASRLSYTRAAC